MENQEIHPLNGGCWVGDLEVEFVTTFLGDLPGLSCRWTLRRQGHRAPADRFPTSLEP